MKKTEVKKIIREVLQEQLGGMPQGRMPQGRMPRGRMPQGGNEIFIPLDNHPQAQEIKQIVGKDGRPSPGGDSRKIKIRFTLRPLGLKIIIPI